MSASRAATDPRISRRRKAVARSKRKRALIRGVVALTICGVAWAAFYSPLLEVRELKLIGARHTSSALVAARARIDAQDNLLLVSTSTIARRIRGLPWVKRARVDRKLPGTLSVRVVERRPAMVLATGRARWTLDATGRVLARGAASEGLPVIAGAEGGPLHPGEWALSEEISGVLDAYRTMPGPLRRRVVGAFAPTIERISFSLDSGTLVRYGAAERLAAKNEVLGVLLRRLEREGRAPAYVDVRVPSSPAVATAPARPGE